jgi:predicted Zn-dependent peptidase
MLIHGKYLLFLDEVFDFEKRISQIDAVDLENVNQVANEVLQFDTFATASVGVNKGELTL